MHHARIIQLALKSVAVRADMAEVPRYPTSRFAAWGARRQDKGFILAMCAICLGVLLAVGGFAVDVGNWYLHASRLQRAADAAALAGAIYLPGDSDSAIDRAESLLTQNDFPIAGSEVKVQPLHPTQLKVTITEDVSNHFVQLIGLNKTRLSRAAVGEYHPYIPMGSPSNVLGIEAPQLNAWEKTDIAGTQSNYWLNISAAGTPKSTGDRFSSGICTNGTDGCNVSTTPPWGNVDYSTFGQRYIIRIKPGTTGRLAVEAFDPEFASVGDLCDSSTLKNNNTQYSDPTNTGILTWGSDNPACTGDNASGSGTPPTTTFQLFTPEISATGSQPINVTGCTPTNGAGIYPGYNENVISRYNNDAMFRSYFRKWSRVCTLQLGSQFPPGDYILNVRNGNSTAVSGLNRFALRAGILTQAGTLDTAMTANVSLFSQGRLVVYAKDKNADSTFYIARILPGAKGQTLVVTLFDIGDAAEGASLRFIPPTDATSGGNPMVNFSSCKYKGPGQSTYVNMGSGCSISNMTSSTYNGKVVLLKVSLPADYECDDDSPSGCWTRLKLHYNSGNVTDTTSWVAALNANPAHLVPDKG